MPNEPDLTPVAVASQLAAVVFGASVAVVVGPYIVICIGAMGGAAVAIMQRDSRGNLRAFVYFMCMTSLSVMLTVPLAMMLAAFWEPMRSTWLFAPISFALGFSADKTPAIMAWLGSKINSFVDAWILTRGQK